MDVFHSQDVRMYVYTQDVSSPPHLRMFDQNRKVVLFKKCDIFLDILEGQPFFILPKLHKHFTNSKDQRYLDLLKKQECFVHLQ